MTITGAVGCVRWGYYTAAQVRSWTLTPADGGSWALSATVESADAYKVTQRPLVFVAAKQIWPVVTLQIEGASLTAVLGPKESAHVLPIREAEDRSIAH
jgi:hypothetical protein